MKASRRGVLGGAGAAAAGALAWAAPWRRPIPGSDGGAAMARGHRLRDGGFPEPVETHRTRLVIAGGGVAGLAAGWALAEAGFTDFRLLELEDATGGNARSGRNAVSAFPLGAHYLPVPNEEARALCAMLGRLGMVVGEKEGRPVYDPLQLCADLTERLLWKGRWQEGLIPRIGVSRAEQAEFAAFDQAMRALSERIGSDGRPAFAVPLAYSSRDADLLRLDDIGFAEWLDRQGWRAPALRAHIRYACRDDYGTEPEHLSAWAGIHYFACRRGFAADGAGDGELTWPEGNARLTGLMAARFADRIARGHVVFRVQRGDGGVLVDSFDVARRRSIRIRADAAILAMPHFVAARVLIGAALPTEGFSYAPWLVANVTVDRPPGGRGCQLAWDNVSATSPSLGYVVATHQTAARSGGPTVLTWYMPLSDMTPAVARRLLVERPAEDWRRFVADDLLGMNPDLEGAIRTIDLWRWGHAMIRPTPGFISRVAPAAAEAVRPPLFLAHSDLSGLSLFEEAHYRGTVAAEGAMTHLRHSHESML